MSDQYRTLILKALSKLKDPDGGDPVSRGRVSEFVFDGNKVSFSLLVPADRVGDFEPLRQAASQAAMVRGIDKAIVSLTAARPGGTPAERARPHTLPDVTAIIAVASGKGGVGKSTTSVNLALALAASGLAVGLLDADIFGPSLPRLLGIRETPAPGQERRMKALHKYGLALMSMGFLVEEGTPVAWRGPMVMSAIRQMISDVEWGRLDILVVDMPPGTGDVQLTLSQTVPLAGSLIVSTPQDLALIDARKALAMFNKVEVPILGIVENMSYYCCPNCGFRDEVFAHGGAEADAERLGLDFLGRLPLATAIRQFSDDGLPIVIGDPESALSQAYREIAGVVSAKVLGEDGVKNPVPAIIFE